MNLLWRMYQREDNKLARSQSARAARQSDRTAQSLADLEGKVDQLALTCQALWELVREKTDLDDSDILERISEVDLRDGTADGRMTAQVQECASCHRVLHRRHRRCMYCGAAAPTQDVFDL
ncbi:MAG: hypothetical protein QNJ40_24315 [Xanthomonadales bacterium]|nr:hypothetical protein [Xanthomonadales bacterium]